MTPSRSEARTSQGAAGLSGPLRSGRVARTYLTVVEVAWPDESGKWEDSLLNDERTNVAAVSATEETECMFTRSLGIANTSGSFLTILYFPGYPLKIGSKK
jgi:23S rRNA-/tRNA-specific pseudouridylate synthase